MLLIETSLQQLSLDLESLLYSVGECQAELLQGSAAAGLPEKYTLDSEDPNQTIVGYWTQRRLFFCS